MSGIQSKMPWRGSVRRSNRAHQDARKSQYERDQEQQRAAREAERRIAHRARKEEYHGRPNVHVATGTSVSHDDSRWEPASLKFVIDREGRELTQDEHEKVLADRESDRKRYRRPGGKWERFRERKTEWVTDPNTGKKKKKRVEVPDSEVSAVRYEAFLLQPHHSAGLVLASLAGRGNEARTLAIEVTKAALGEFERFSGHEAVAGPFHPKLFAGHMQISSVRVDATGKLLAPADVCAHLGRKLMGAWALHEIYDFRGETLDEITGHSNAWAGICDVVDDRGERSIDFHMFKFIGTELEQRLATPAFACLREFVDAGRQLVLKFERGFVNFVRATYKDDDELSDGAVAAPPTGAVQVSNASDEPAPLQEPSPVIPSFDPVLEALERIARGESTAEDTALFTETNQHTLRRLAKLMPKLVLGLTHEDAPRKISPQHQHS